MSELSYKDTGMSIVDLAHSDQERYFFFDLAEEDLQNSNAQLALLNGEHTPLMNVFQTVSYTPGYFMTSLNPGFQYCQEVARFVGTSSQHKEYAAVDCSLAAKGQFSKEMHPDILAYAQHLAQQ